MPRHLTRHEALAEFCRLSLAGHQPTYAGVPLGFEEWWVWLLRR